MARRLLMAMLVFLLAQAAFALDMQTAPDVTALRARAAAELARGDTLAAAALYDDLIHHLPDDREALRGRVFALRDGGAAQRAATLAAQSPAAFSAREQLALRQGSIGRAIQWGRQEGEAGIGKTRLAATRRALNALDAARSAAQAAGLADSDAALALEFDALVALRDAGRMDDAIAAYRALRARHITVPPYGLAAVAAAYLERRQPRRALALYRAALAASVGAPGYPDRRWQLAEIDCLLDLHRYAEAESQTARLLRELPPVWHRGLAGVEVDNEWYAEATVKAVAVQTEAERLDRAETLLAAARLSAPFSPDLRIAAGELLQRRDQPRAAESLYREVLVDDPAHVGAALGLADTALALEDVHGAERYQPALQEHYREQAGVQRLARDTARYRGPMLSIDANGGHSGSGGSNRGSSDWSADTTLTSPLLAERWRVQSHAYTSQARFGSDTVSRERLGIGAAYRYRDWQADAEVNQNVDGFDATGAALHGAWLPDDYWQWDVRLDTHSNDVPLQADALGIRMDSAALAFSYRHNESRELGTSLRYASLTDGNQRLELESHWQQRWLSGPRYRFDTRASVATSHASAHEAVYFNPRRDISLELETQQEWSLWRGRDIDVVARVSVAGGAYWQRDFGTLPLLVAQCEQVWRFGPYRELGVGLRYDNHPYDGASDRRLGGTLTLAWRF